MTAPHQEDVKAVGKALWLLDCAESEEEYKHYGRVLPERWADPWDENGGGKRQREGYERRAENLIIALDAARQRRGE